MTTPDDHPLTIVDIGEDGTVPLFVLAQRVAAHLDGDWRISATRADGALLEGPDNLKLTFSMFGNGPYRSKTFHVGTFTPTGRRSEKTTPMFVFALPSNIASDLDKEILPAVRKRLAAARKQLATQGDVSERRKTRISAIADRLNWNASSYKTHSGETYPSLDPRYRKRRARGTEPVLQGHIGYDEPGGMHMHLTGLPEDLVDKIVDLLADHFTPRPDGPEASGPEEENGAR